MKKSLSIFFLGLMLMGCEPEPTADLNNTTADSPLIPKHNLTWNGNNYLLVFDTAYASVQGGDGIQGCGPAFIVFYSLYHDEYSGEKFKLLVSAGPSIYGDADNQYYVASEVQLKLNDVEQLLLKPHVPNAMFIGSKLNYIGSPPNYGSTLYNYYTPNLKMKLLSFSTYYVNTDKFANFHLIATADNLDLNLEGKFKAQDQD
jgi:hypothetical protein